MLFPTLISVGFQNESNMAILTTEMSTHLIVEFINSHIQQLTSSSMMVPVRV